MNMTTTNEPSNVKKTELYFQAFRIGEKEIGELWATLECNGKNKVIANARCADHTERMFEMEQGLVQFDNMDKRRIKELTLWTKNKETEYLAGHVSLYTEDKDYNISTHLTGRSETEIQEICKSIKEILERSQPGYAMFTITRGMIYVGVVVVSVQIFIWLNWIVAISPWGEPALGWNEETQEIYIWTLSGLWAIWVLWLGGEATKLWRRCFPIGCFHTGDQMRQEKMKQKWRWIAASLAIGAVISTVINIIV